MYTTYDIEQYKTVSVYESNERSSSPLLPFLNQTTLYQMDRNFDVLIIGGGIAGFATAAFLRQRGPWRIAIVERRQEAVVIRNTNDNDDPHDFGIALASNGCAMLSLLGMSDPVEELNGCELEKVCAVFQSGFKVLTQGD